MGRLAWPFGFVLEGDGLFSSGAGGGGGLLEAELRGEPWNVELVRGARSNRGRLEELGRERRRVMLAGAGPEASDVGSLKPVDEVGDGSDL